MTKSLQKKIMGQPLTISNREYRKTDRMRDLIADNTLLLSALSRFEISLGFGDQTVGEVCKRNNVDGDTFLAVANMISNRRGINTDINLHSIIAYLKNAHNYFLDFVLPSIRRKLIDAINTPDAENVSFLILKFFDDYKDEVNRHMNYEDDHVFAYVEKLIAGERAEGFDISKYQSNHKPIATKLHELKEIIICHYSGDRSNVNFINSVLFDIIVCERDLMKHCEVEDELFVPAVKALEQSIESNVQSYDKEVEGGGNTDLDGLSEREREIIACVARGMSNKEIAEKLYLSVHTVATHRRNVSSKLQIHSAAGLTIFAIIHKLIDLSEVNLKKD